MRPERLSRRSSAASSTRAPSTPRRWRPCRSSPSWRGAHRHSAASSSGCSACCPIRTMPTAPRSTRSRRRSARTPTSWWPYWATPTRRYARPPRTPSPSAPRHRDRCGTAGRSRTTRRCAPRSRSRSVCSIRLDPPRVSPAPSCTLRRRSGSPPPWRWRGTAKRGRTARRPPSSASWTTPRSTMPGSVTASGPTNCWS